MGTVLVCGIDPSLSGTGLVLPDGTRHVVGSTTWAKGKVPDVAARFERYQGISVAMGRLLRPFTEQLAYRHDDGRPEVYGVAVVEGYAYAKSDALHAQIVEAGWVLRRALLLAGWHVVEVPSNQVKFLATGKGRGVSKPDMRMALFKTAGIDDNDENRVDAWWLWQAGCIRYGTLHAHRLPKPQRELVTRLRWPDAVPVPLAPTLMED